MKKKLLIMTIIAMIILTIGITYAIFIQRLIGDTNTIAITGDIWMKYDEGEKIELTNAIPMAKEEALEKVKSFNFTITGKNTSDKDIYYGISLESESIEGKTKLKESDIMVYLTSGDEVLVDGIRYQVFSGKVYVDKIAGGTKNEVSKNYQMKVWLREGLIVSDTVENASYTLNEWENLYTSLKVIVDGNLEYMNMPLSIEHDDTLVENNKQYFVANVKNYLNPDEEGEILTTNDNINLEVTSNNQNIAFFYKDSEGNEVTEPSNSLSIDYIFNKKKSIDVKTFVIPTNDTNTNTDITVKLTKNGEEVYNQVINMNIMGNNYCLNNGFDKLNDCILVSEIQSKNINDAKEYISSKAYNVTNTAPVYTYVEDVSYNSVSKYTVNGEKLYFANSYEFDSTTGRYKLTNHVEDYLADKYLNYYTCDSDIFTDNTCKSIRKIKEILISGSTYTISVSDLYNSKVSTSLISEQGLYKTEDDSGDTYFYRGPVENNNVYFGGYYWKILRLNGDSSIRMIYSGKTKDATDKDLSINNTLYQYNEISTDATYVGYMYDEEFSIVTSSEASFSMKANDKYYFASNFELNEANKTFNLTGNITTEALTWQEMNNLGSNGFTKYPYACINPGSTGNCRIVLQFVAYREATRSKVYYISYSSNGLDAIRGNKKSSGIKDIIDKWYEDNFVSKYDSNNTLLTNYIVDGSFCNDRSLSEQSKNNSNLSFMDTIYFKAYDRHNDVLNSTVDLKCETDIRDKFSSTNSKGNSKLKYPIALITSDEVVLAGAVYRLSNNNYFLASGNNVWTMTPNTFNHNIPASYMYHIKPDGSLYAYADVSGLSITRPVINLSPSVLIEKGDGSIDNPYELKLS